MTVKKTSARKSLCQFLDILDVKPKTSVCMFCAAKTKCKSIRAGSMLWYSIPNRRGYLKINQQSKQIYLKFNSTTSSGCGVSNSKLFSKISIDGQVEPQLVLKLLLHLFFR